MSAVRFAMSYSRSGEYQFRSFSTQGNRGPDSVTNGWQISGGPACASCATKTAAARAPTKAETRWVLDMTTLLMGIGFEPRVSNVNHRPGSHSP